MDQEKSELFKQFIDDSIVRGKKNEGESLKKYTYKEVEPYLIELAKKIGMDLKGVTRVITDGFINKEIDHHGDPVYEKNRGNVSITGEDLKEIPEITESPDMILAGIKRGKDNPNHIAYGKTDNGITSIFLDRHFPTKKELRSNSFYKPNFKQPVTKTKFINSLKRNSKSDVSSSIFADINDIKKAGVDDPGGHPGETPIMEKSAAAAIPAQSSGRLLNYNIPQLSSEIKRNFDENTKAHIKALYKWER